MRLLTPQKGGGFLVEYPDVPGCMSDGETVEEALSAAKKLFGIAFRCSKNRAPNFPRQPSRLHNGASVFRELFTAS